ncbi:hypothetical protein AALO_G00109040 [Alosa alosa]|uniref:Peptidase S1 domain-containing protein n=1 Tax=Alosa alosa TaxID=278164 RepID=A0AAV6GT28_9TELE|nr:transmembrane protease serine 12-like [Alosa alosa]KAG5276726.1 hypothetical protein AALO_G00109040 [Alosa alosa]
MNLCGKFSCLIGVGSICLILYFGVVEQSGFYLESDCGNRPENKAMLPPLHYMPLFGYPVNISIWPWIVSLQYSHNGLDSFKQYCSGAIIYEDWILTATSCFYETAFRNSRNWRIQTGSSDLNYNSPHIQTSTMEDVILHKDYHPDSSWNNIALVKLTTPLVFNNFVDRVCIPDLMNVERFKYSTCHITVHDNTGVLKESPVNIFPHSTCNMLSWHKFKVSADMFCAGYEYGGFDGCLDDTGGPLSCYVPTTGRHYVRGLRIITKKCGVPRRPNIYLQVSKYYYWIANAVDRYKEAHS